MTTKERKQRVAQAVIEQGGICPICRFGDFCVKCERYEGHGHDGPCKLQKVNTFDHNHACCKGGCAKCFRGALHSYCNRQLIFLERHPWIASDFVQEYIKRGLPETKELEGVKDSQNRTELSCI